MKHDWLRVSGVGTTWWLIVLFVTGFTFENKAAFHTPIRLSGGSPPLLPSTRKNWKFR